MHATSLLLGLSSRAAQSLSFPVGAHVVFDGLPVSVLKQTEFQTISVYYGVLQSWGVLLTWSLRLFPSCLEANNTTH